VLTPESEAVSRGVFECPRELLRKQLKESEFGQCLWLAVSYILDRVNNIEKYLRDILMAP
jgi:hypothetical protein